MKKLVCERFCPFYNPGREEPNCCGSFAFLERNLTKKEIGWAAGRTGRKLDMSSDDLIRKMVCEKTCEFYSARDCDFRLGLDSPPCGGYAIVEDLLRGSEARVYQS